MNIRPIKTEADYQDALKVIEKLFDAVPNTPEGDCLEVLTTLVEAYEEQQYSIPAPDLIEAVLYHMESRVLKFFGMSEGFWIALQRDYDAARGKDALGATLSKIKPWTRVKAGDVAS